MDKLTEHILVRCNFCHDSGLGNSSYLESHILQNHYHQLFHCLLCSSLGNQPGGFEKFVDVAKHVVEELLLDSTDRKKICQKIVCPGNPQDLKVFRCLFCPYEGMAFVGVPEEVFLKHVSDQHGEEAVKHSPHKLVWECRVCRGLLRDDADLTRHIVKRHAGSNRSIFNNFPFGAFTNEGFKAPVAHSNEDLKLSKLENRINYETKLSDLDEPSSNINDEYIDNKLDNTEPEVNNQNNNVTGLSFLEEDNITELSYSETDETRFLRTELDDSDLWSEHNDSFVLENIVENNNTKENDSQELTKRTRNKISNDEAINSDTNDNKEVSFLCSHCPDACTHKDTAQALLKDVHNLLEKVELKPRENLLEKAELKPREEDLLDKAILKLREDLLEDDELKPPSFLVEAVCRICQPVHRVVAKSSTQLFCRVADHMAEHQEVCREGEVMVRYGCRLCVDREWDHLSQVLGHVGRRHQGETTRSQESYERVESRESHRRVEGQESPRRSKSQESRRRAKGQKSPIRRVNEKEITRMGKSRCSPRRFKSQESPRRVKVPESPRKGKTQESSRRGKSPESLRRAMFWSSPRRCKRKESPRRGKLQESPKRGKLQESPKRGKSQESPRRGRSQEYPRRKKSWKSPGRGKSQESSKRIKDQESLRTNKSRGSPRRVKPQDSPRRSNSQECSRRGKRIFKKVKLEDEPRHGAKPSSTLDKYDEKNKNEKKARKSSNLKKYQHDKKFYFSENSIASVQLKERSRRYKK